MTRRRNMPPINPNGAKFDVYVHPYGGAFCTSPMPEMRLSKQYLGVMKQVGHYIEAGFAVTYKEEFTHDRKRAIIEIRP